MYSVDITSLPDAPGIYQFFNHHQQIIYIGKAKNIKKRVASYFRKQGCSNQKLRKLIAEIKHVHHIITNTEYDALLLENVLIKKHQPKYNILLKDGKTYPYICIVDERFPRIISTRKNTPIQGQHFGPYTHVTSINNMLHLLRQLYSMRTCTYNLSKENIKKKKFKVCLEYHIRNCKGPCTGLQPEEDYNQEIQFARNILRGNFSTVIKYLNQAMQEASHALHFEIAAMYKHKLDLLKRFQDESAVVNKKITAVDIITITSSEKRAFINYMQINEGLIILSKNMEVIKKMNEADETILEYAFREVRQQYKSTNKLVLSNRVVATNSEEIKNYIPRIGDKKRAVELSLKNALSQRKIQEGAKQKKTFKKEKILIALQHHLKMKNLPRIIECFDISNLQTSALVASMVRFVDGNPQKSGYRRYSITTVKSPNDFAAMKEAVSRRYTRLLKEQSTLPDLIIIDGGKGQLSNAFAVLKELKLDKKIAMISIAKKLEEIYYPNDSIPQHINKRSATLLLIQQIRNEAHRFALALHRMQRDKKAFDMELSTIPGISEKTINKLLIEFGSQKKIKEALPTQIERVIGRKKTELLLKKLTK